MPYRAKSSGEDTMRFNLFANAVDVIAAVRLAVDNAARMVARIGGRSEHRMHYLPGPSRLLVVTVTDGKRIPQCDRQYQSSWRS
jgi:3-methyladenine DNA glycosylase/8-oxoguanine DNA glycosylase